MQKYNKISLNPGYTTLQVVFHKLIKGSYWGRGGLIMTGIKKNILL